MTANPLTTSAIQVCIRYLILWPFVILLAQISLAQGDPDKPDFLSTNLSDEEFMKLRSEGIGLKRGVEINKPFDPTKRVVAVRQMQAQRAQLANRPQDTEINSLLQTAWTEIGPNPIPNGQVVSGSQLSVSGRTIAIAVHPTNPDIVYVGTAQGGLYRSLDGGLTWVPLLDNALSLAVNAVAIAPSQPNTIFVGTGEAGFSADSYFGVGIYRIDNANSASPVITGPIGSSLFTGRSVSKIVVHPTDANIIFASSSSGIGGISGSANNILMARGVFRSTDALSGSPSFTKLTISGLAGQDRPFIDLIMDPGNPDLLLCTEGDSFSLGEGGVYRSTNALAVTPTFVRTFAAGAGISLSRTELALHRSAVGVVTVYAASGFNGGTVHRSIDGGATWTQRIDNNFCGGQCFYNIAIAVDPTNADRVYLGGTGTTTTFAISTNGGTSFTNSQSGLHTDSHVITVAPSLPSTVYFGSDGGIYKSTNSGASWTSLNNSTFKATQFMSLAVHPIDPNFTIGGTQDNGTIFYRPAATWTRADFGDGGYSLIDQGATDNVNVDMYHTYFNNSTLQGYATVSTTASATEGNWNFRGCDGIAGNGIPCGGAVLFYAPIEQGPGTPNTIYFGANILYRSANKGLNHTAVSQNLTNPISAIGISPQNDNVRIVGLNTGGIFGTTTGSTTLTNLDAGGAIPNSFIARAVIDPNNVNTAYATLSAFGVVNIWKTTNLNNASPSWTAAATGIPQVPVNAFVVEPGNSSHLYAGTDIGVYASTDGGASWLPFGTGLPVVAVFDMAIQPVSRVLRIATHGRGLWENPIGSAGVCIVNCPASITVPNDLNQCGAVVTFAAPTTIGTCGLVSMSHTSGSFFPVGTTIVTATSEAGPTCTFTVKVQDTQAPTITCPANIIVSNNFNQCGAVVNFPAITGADNCGSVTVTTNPASGSFFPVGTTTVTVTASDASVNSADASCTFTVTVNDTQAPAIACPANITVSNNFNQCGAVVNFPAITGTDNCSVTVTTNPASGSFFSVGTTTVIVTASDASANSADATCTFMVTVQDTQAPAITCPANVNLNTNAAGCTGFVSSALTTPGITDNCAATSVGWSVSGATPASSGSGNLGDYIFRTGTSVVTYTVSDVAGNSSVCAFNVVVTNAVTGTASGTATVLQNPVTTSTITFTGNGGAANYTFTYNINGGATQTISTTGGSNVVTVIQSNATTGTFTYNLLSVTDANGCTGTLSAPPSATITVVSVGTPDLTCSQFFTTTQIATGGIIDEVVAIRNVGTVPTSAPVAFTVTNYAPITGLTVTQTPNPTVTIGFTTYTTDNANWTFNPVTGTFTSNAGVFINPGATKFIGVRINRAAGANGATTHTVTIPGGTGGGETSVLNNSISNNLLKN